MLCVSPHWCQIGIRQVSDRCSHQVLNQLLANTPKSDLWEQQTTHVLSKMSSVCMCVVVYRQVCNTHMNTHIRIQRGMTVYVNASYSCTGIHRRAWQQTREATCESNKRHVCCDVRGSKKSSLHMYIVRYAILTYIHTERLYMGIFSAIYRHPYTGKTSH